MSLKPVLKLTFPQVNGENQRVINVFEVVENTEKLHMYKYYTIHMIRTAKYMNRIWNEDSDKSQQVSLFLLKNIQSNKN